jgi:MbtH protein
MISDYEAPENERFVVVVNDEGQHSILLDAIDIPGGWESVGFEGTKAECLEHVREIWTDIRPRSVHRFLTQLATPLDL